MNKMYRFFSSRLFGGLVAVLSLAAILPSCKDNDDQYESPLVLISPSLPDNTVKFDKDGGSMELTITSNRDWTVESSDDWLAVTPSAGKKGRAATVIVKALPNNGPARQAGFRFVVSGKYFSYTVNQQSNKGEDFKFTSLAELAEMGSTTGKEGFTIDKDLNIRVLVVNDASGRNFLFSGFHYVTDEENNGLVLTVPKGEAAYAFGDRLTANIKGCKLSNYNGTIQLEVPHAKTQVSPGMEVTPLSATIEEINTGKFRNVLVRISDVQFVKYQNELMYSGTFFMKSHTLIDRKGHKLDVEVLKNAAFKDEPLPAGSGSIVAIVALYQKDASQPMKYSLKPSLYTDISMTGKRFDSGDPDPSPVDETRPLADLIAMGRPLKAKETLTVEDSFNVEVTVTANNSTKQLSGDGYYYVQDLAGSAVVLRFGKNSATTYQIGEKLTVSVKGGKLSNYYGSITFDLSDAQVKASPGTAVAPKPVTVEQLGAAVQDKFVLLSGVQLKVLPAAGSLLENPGEQYYTKWEFTDKSGKTFFLEIKKGCTFGNLPVPTGRGSVSGIVTVFNGVYSIRPVTAAGLNLNDPRS